MEETILSQIPGLGPAAIALIVVIYIYLKISSDRKTTKAERDEDSRQLHDTMIRHDAILSEHGKAIEKHSEEFVELRKNVQELNVHLVELTTVLKEWRKTESSEK